MEQERVWVPPGVLTATKGLQWSFELHSEETQHHA